MSPLAHRAARTREGYGDGLLGSYRRVERLLLPLADAQHAFRATQKGVPPVLLPAFVVLGAVTKASLNATCFILVMCVFGALW